MVRHRLGLGLMLCALAACSGAGDTGGAGGGGGKGGGGGTAGAPDASTDAPTTSDAGAAGTQDAAPDAGCASGSEAVALQGCLEQGQGPDDCVASLGTELCDADGDGLGDDLESAIAEAYAPVFAFNSGAYGGNLETDWPASHSHFIAHSTLDYRPDGQSSQIVDPAPSETSIASAVWDGHAANLPQAGEGSDFWLCLTDSSDATRVTSRAAMLALPGGIDLVTVIHPANGTLAQSSHLFAFFYLFFAYNAHSLVDDHEGDWEGIGVFVNRTTGAIDAAWFERHDTTDNTRFIDVASYGAKDPSAETPAGNVSSSEASLHGVRFWDYGGLRHHVVAYVGTGGHAMYDYPANTYIVLLGPRDTHDGDADKLLPWLDELVPGWSEASQTPLSVTAIDAGEAGEILPTWARFRGQWGCDNGTIAKSWPGPFGNDRHPRPVVERTWGSPPAP